MKPSIILRSRLSLSLDSHLKTAVLDTAALNRETPATLINRALAHYLEQRRTESEQLETPCAQTVTRAAVKQKNKK